MAEHCAPAFADTGILDNKVFCPLPFVHVNNTTDGCISACCHSTGPIRRPDGTPYSLVHGDSFSDAFRSQYMDELRENMLAGRRDPQCAMCWSLEDLGIKSKRIHDGFRFLKQVKERLKKGEIAEFKPLSWDIKLGSVCNLKCRMCEPYTSSAILQESVEQGQISPEEAQAYLKSNGNLLQYPRVLLELKEIMPYVEEMYFLGGEPTLNKSHIEILQLAVETGKSKNITIRWSTNLTHFSDKFIELARHFKHVIIDCSIDGYDSVNEYIRYPVKWSEVISALDRIQSQLPQAFLKAVCTVQVYNIFSLDQFAYWAERRRLSVGFNFLSYPNYLSARILPAHIKQELAQSYAQNPQCSSLANWLLDPVETSVELMAKFFKETDRLDRIRAQNIENIIPCRHLKDMREFSQSAQITGEKSAKNVPL